ncbi:MAG: hypothetical protein MK188_05990, partial [Gammaproteobacteria bacterium]|nr:hypothetical protein [Gammaproteobacteria bacterium]
RTSDRLVRSQVLYPAELHARIFSASMSKLIMLNRFEVRDVIGLKPINQRFFLDLILLKTKVIRWRRRRDSNPR